MHHSRDNIQDLLRQARVVLEPADPGEDAVAARAAITGQDRSGGTPPSRAATATEAAAPVHALVAPDPYPTATEQAEHELTLACALVLNAPEAAASLNALVETQHIDPEGALVFAALLHVTGRHHAARFWWQFAAGGGSATAAYCLHLDHQRRGEFHDAAHWHSQATRHPGPPAAPAGHAGPVEQLLPDRIRHDLLAQSYDGTGPRLPGAVEAAVAALCASPYEEYGDIPEPTVEFTRRLARVC
jgi:hypothetical protein